MVHHFEDGPAFLIQGTLKTLNACRLELMQVSADLCRSEVSSSLRWDNVLCRIPRHQVFPEISLHDFAPVLLWCKTNNPFPLTGTPPRRGIFYYIFY